MCILVSRCVGYMLYGESNCPEYKRPCRYITNRRVSLIGKSDASESIGSCLNL